MLALEVASPCQYPNESTIGCSHNLVILCASPLSKTSNRHTHTHTHTYTYTHAEMISYNADCHY